MRNQNSKPFRNYAAVIVMLIFGVVCFAGCIYNLKAIWEEHQRIVSFSSAPAVVLSVDINERIVRDSEDGDRITYIPVVAYRYIVDGHSYTSQQVTSREIPLSYRTAHHLVARFTPGRPTVAYYNPQDTADAFLLPFYSSSSYTQALFGFVGAVGLILGARGMSRRGRSLQPAVTFDGRFALNPRFSLTSRCACAIVLTLAWHTLGLLLAIHYFSQTLRTTRFHPVIIFSVYELIGLLPLVVACRSGLLLRCAAGPKLYVDTLFLRLGQSVVVTVEEWFRCRPRSLALTLLCTCTTMADETSITTEVYREGQEIPLDGLRSHLLFMARIPVMLPENREMLSAEYEWVLRLTASFSLAPMLQIDFPFELADSEVAETVT